MTTDEIFAEMDKAELSVTILRHGSGPHACAIRIGKFGNWFEGATLADAVSLAWADYTGVPR